jgi:hypothetical protein
LLAFAGSAQQHQLLSGTAVVKLLGGLKESVQSNSTLDS